MGCLDAAGPLRSIDLFKDFSLSPPLLKAVEALGYTEPTPIQERAIPVVLAGRDLMAAAQTGTGKTAAFALPLLERLLQNPVRQRSPRALVLVPTRELAAQVSDACRALARNLPIRGALIYGGVSARPQLDALAGGVDLVIATPGRLLDHLESRAIDLSKIEMLVLDEG
jgi:ATP-dependent RNA helicase RhlE